MRRSHLLLPLCLVVALLAGCGQKGPLVPLPTKPATAKPASASSTAKPLAPAPAASSATPASNSY